jgi:ribosomal protein L29
MDNIDKVIDEICVQYNVLNCSRENSKDTLQHALSEAFKKELFNSRVEFLAKILMMDNEKLGEIVKEIARTT